MSVKKLSNSDFSNISELIEIYPFIDELVETLCTQKTKTLIKKHIETDSDKQTFLMFIFLYFSIELKFIGMEGMSDEEHKKGLKYIMSEIIKNPEKRKQCIELFGKRFNNLFLTN